MAEPVVHAHRLPARSLGNFDQSLDTCCQSVCHGDPPRAGPQHRPQRFRGHRTGAGEGEPPGATGGQQTAQERIEGPKRGTDARALDCNVTAEQRQHGSAAFDRREHGRLPQTPVQLFERRERQGRGRGEGAFPDQRASSLKRLGGKPCSVIVAAVGREPRGRSYRPGCCQPTEKTAILKRTFNQ